MQFLIRPPPDRAERKSGQISESVCILTQRMQGKEICVEMRFIMKSKVKKRCKCNFKVIYFSSYFLTITKL